MGLELQSTETLALILKAATEEKYPDFDDEQRRCRLVKCIVLILAGRV